MLSFDALYVMSDLHFGGVPGFRIVHPDAVTRLAAAVRALATTRPGERVGLVLNGDIIDTLAEPPGTAIRVDDGVATFHAIANDASFGRFFDALGVFVRRGQRTLVVGIGNHDLELALPEVQEAFVRRVAGGDATAAARIRFTPPCQPMLFSVGGHRVFVTHGNEVDEWNVVDADQLVWAIDRRMRGLPFDAAGWRPNAGTRLVREVMNELKVRYPFVDLLKPEREVTVPLLVALDKRAFAHVGGVAGATIQAGLTPTRRLGLLGEDRTARPADDLLGEAVARAGAADTRSGGDFLVEAEGRARRGEAGVAPAGAAAGTLGGGLVNVILGANLHRAVEGWLRAQRHTFDPTVPDAMDDKLIERIGPGVAVVIAGHTHLPRSLRPEGRGFVYLNTGTWARVIALTLDDVDDASRWKEVEAQLRAGTMDALDTTHLSWRGGPLARTTGLLAVVEVVTSADGRRRVQARLERHTAPAGEHPDLEAAHIVGEVTA